MTTSAGVGGDSLSNNRRTLASAYRTARLLGLAYPLRLAIYLSAFTILCLHQYGLGLKWELYVAPSKNPFQSNHDAFWYHESILHTLLGHILGFSTTKLTFGLFVLGFYFLGLIYLAFVIRKKVSETWSLVFLAIVVFHPISVIVFTWMGHPDAVLFLCTAVLFFADSAWILFAFSLMGSLANSSQMFIIVLMVLALRGATEPLFTRHRKYLAVPCGWIVGRILVELYLWWFDIWIKVSRGDMVVERWMRNAWGGYDNPDYIWQTLYSAYLSCWPLFLVVCYLSFSVSRRLGVLLVLSNAAALGVTLAVVDHTRILAILLWGPFVYSLYRTVSHLPRLRSWKRGLLMTALFVSLIGGFFCRKEYSFDGQLFDMVATRETFINLVINAITSSVGAF